MSSSCLGTTRGRRSAYVWARSLGIGARIGHSLRGGQRSMSEDVLHEFVAFLPFGVVLSSGDARMLHANPLARHFIARRQPVWADADGRLVGETPSATRRLRDAIRAVTGGGATRSPLSARVGHRVLPIVVRGLAPAGAGTAGVAAICIAAPRLVPRENVLAELHDLTPPQARLAAELLQGHGLTAAARRLKLNPNTAKSQLQRLFQKTGAVRQSDLVRLLL